MKEYLQWVIKGAAMGMADVVPGVSGGTLAFILGIYERFINALTSFNLTAVKLLLRREFVKAWQHIDGTFLLCVFAGILSAIFSLATLISYLLETNPVPLWSFFNGLIVASFPMLIKNVNWSAYRGFIFSLGVVFAIIITSLTPMHATPSAWMFFGAGFIAICAMILPGISGSFLLLIMGMYAPITAAVSELELGVLMLFALGCITGLLLFSRVLKWSLARAHDAMLAFLSGIVLGSLFRIWPWQIESTLLTPAQFAEQTGEHHLLASIAAFILGAALIQTLLHLEKLFKSKD
ncbi:MAG: putative membrane protein [Idiomarinaceae bacterium HL-53]|nr:MAG: putative membrane protein [Idiomarinaceae bacterium HL-53]CUS49560.1 putative membrane protein [Idiomarinaceae bacterium HL-53]